jgi:hypothetical protein
MKMMVILCINTVCRGMCLKIVVIINENIYWHGIGRMCNCLKRHLHEVLDCAPAIILMIFFCKVKIFPLLEELTLNIIPYFIIECGYA